MADSQRLLWPPPLADPTGRADAFCVIGGEQHTPLPIDGAADPSPENLCFICKSVLLRSIPSTMVREFRSMSYGEQKRVHMGNGRLLSILLSANFIPYYPPYKAWRA